MNVYINKFEQWVLRNIFYGLFHVILPVQDGTGKTRAALFQRRFGLHIHMYIFLTDIILRFHNQY